MVNLTKYYWIGKEDFKRMNVRKANYGRCIQVIKMTTKHNVLKVHGQNSYAHEKLKFDIVYLLRKNKVNIATEVEFKNGGRCDIIDLDNAVVYEILNTESLQDFEEKKFSYPSFLTLVPIKVSDNLDFEALIKFLGVD